MVTPDIGGTLVDSKGFEDDCFIKTISSAMDIDLNRDWSLFKQALDTSIINELLDSIPNSEQRTGIND